MKAPHWWQVSEGPEAFAELFAAARALGLRLGWLELELGFALPEPLEVAASAGALRAVALSAGRSVAVKSRQGPAVPLDLLREHFLGCAAVLVRGESSQASALLSREGEAFRLRAVAADSPTPGPLSAEQLAARLRKIRPAEP